jgi:peptide chain release factor 3
LQFEVMADRLANEYQLEVIFEASPFAEARWIGGAKADLEEFQSTHRSAMGVDIDDQPVFLAKSAWEIGYVAERYPKVRFERSKERA